MNRASLLRYIDIEDLEEIVEELNLHEWGGDSLRLVLREMNNSNERAILHFLIAALKKNKPK